VSTSDRSGTVVVDVAIEAGLWAELPEAEAWVRRAAEAAIAVAEVALRPDVELSVLLSNDARLHELNMVYRHQDKPTNVLSFPAEEPDALADAPQLGDVVIAGETLLAEAKADGKPPLHHLAHLVVHGTLHLLGHDHEDDAEAEAMEALERRALATLAISDPYRETVLAPGAE
jgi:probable rRNA maturation factor